MKLLFFNRIRIKRKLIKKGNVIIFPSNWLFQEDQTFNYRVWKRQCLEQIVRDEVLKDTCLLFRICIFGNNYFCCFRITGSVQYICNNLSLLMSSIALFICMPNSFVACLLTIHLYMYTALLLSCRLNILLMLQKLKQCSNEIVTSLLDLTAEIFMVSMKFATILCTYVYRVFLSHKT